MDSILILGGSDEKLPKFLSRLGYEVLAEGADVEFDVLTQRVVDLIFLDSRMNDAHTELCQFLRTNEVTRRVPIIYLTDEDVPDEIKGIAGAEKLETMATTSGIGAIASKIATQLRLRKFDGADSLNATVGEANATLRDLNERLMKERQEARKIQQALLPPSLPEGESFEIATHYSPLDEIGGDWYYALTTKSGKILFLAADVTGHGLAAALIGSMTKLAMSAADRESPDELLEEMNRLMSPQLPEGRFVTMCCALYDPESGELLYASAGHPPGILFNRESGEVKEIAGKGFALGFFDEGTYSLEKCHLNPGDVFVCFTDGITEAQNLSGEMYGSSHFIDLIPTFDKDKDANRILAALLADFGAYLEGRILKDDVTMIVFKRR